MYVHIRQSVNMHYHGKTQKIGRDQLVVVINWVQRTQLHLSFETKDHLKRNESLAEFQKKTKMKRKRQKVAGNVKILMKRQKVFGNVKDHRKRSKVIGNVQNLGKRQKVFENVGKSQERQKVFGNVRKSSET